MRISIVVALALLTVVIAWAQGPSGAGPAAIDTCWKEHVVIGALVSAVVYLYRSERSSGKQLERGTVLLEVIERHLKSTPSKYKGLAEDIAEALLKEKAA